jgi:FlaA1/EpsC-like NDP-sugar epimerase
MVKNLKYIIVQIFRNHSLPRWLVFVIDVTAVLLTFLFSYMLRYNLEPYTFNFSIASGQAFFVSAIYAAYMLLFKSYSGLIRQTTVKDTFIVAVTNTVSFISLGIITILCREFDLNILFNIPLSILVIHFGIITVALIFFRVFIKMFYVFISIPSSKRKNVIIYGSGETGMIVKRVLETDPKQGYQLKAFIDDNNRLQGKKVDGFPVFSNSVLTREYVEMEGIAVFILAIQNISQAKKKEILESVLKLGLEILEPPSLDKWLNGNLHVKQLQKIQFEDLLGREPISLDLMRINKGLKGKTILVTGAAGSIGSEIVRQLTKFEYKQIVLVDQAETPSFYLDNELKEKFNGCKYKLVIGDVTNESKMELLFKKYKPEIVFHAAAYKHVPVMESNPHEAFRVNVGGTKIISELALKYNAEKFVMVSTDKAVNPTNVMGATKRICELLAQAQARKPENKTKFVTTRFGNVLGSNGSVIPLFKKQIAEGGPVTITDPEITRYFMTIPEACQLVLEAGFLGNGGEIFIFDMGEPVKILDVAIKLIHLSGFEPYKDIDIKITGLRPGEKLYEELFSEGELQLPTHNPKINIAKVSEVDYSLLLLKINDTLKNIYEKSDSEVFDVIQEIVPEFTCKYATVSQN